MNRNHKLRYRLIAYMLLVSLFLQSCGDFSNPFTPRSEGTPDNIPIPANPITISQLIGEELAAEGEHPVISCEQHNVLRADISHNKPKCFRGNYMNLSEKVGDIVPLELTHLDSDRQGLDQVKVRLFQSDQPIERYMDGGGLKGEVKRKEHQKKNEQGVEKRAKIDKNICYPNVIKSTIREDVEAWFQLGEKAYQEYQKHRTEEACNEANSWLGKAAEQGHASAQFRLGEIYEAGIGVLHNGLEAVKWYRRAAEQGNVAAQFKLGFMYETGKGGIQNVREAIIWYHQAAEQGHVDAQFRLGLMYERGKDGIKNYQEAIKWYRKAAEYGHFNASYKLGRMYESGKGVTKNHQEAMEWYQKAAEQGHV